MILITHDLGVIAEIADRVMVLYAGRVAETAPVRTIFDAPAHPYTQVLLGSIPDIAARRARLVTIPGSVPGCAQHAAGLPLRAALPVSPAAMRAGAAGAAPARGGPRAWPACAPSANLRCRHERRRADRGARCAQAFSHAHRRLWRDRGGARGGRHRSQHTQGRDARAGRRERLRQVDAGAAVPAADRADRRRDPAQGHRPHQPAPQCARGRDGATCRSSFRIRSVRSIRARRWVRSSPRPMPSTASAIAPNAHGGWPRRSILSPCRAMPRAATRTNFPAASASASASPARWR